MVLFFHDAITLYVVFMVAVFVCADVVESRAGYSIHHCGHCLCIASSGYIEPDEMGIFRVWLENVLEDCRRHEVAKYR